VTARSAQRLGYGMDIGGFVIRSRIGAKALSLIQASRRILNPT